MPSAPDAILRAVAQLLRSKLNLTDPQCFVSIIPIDGIDEYAGDEMIVVCPGGDRPDGGGNGAQDGESLLRRQTIKLQVFYRIKLDMHGRTDEALSAETGNFLSFCEAIISALGLTFLDGILYERVRYEGSGEPRWQDPEHGIIARDLNFSGPFGVRLPYQF